MNTFPYARIPVTRLHRVTLKNFRHFDNLTVEFHPELTVLIARNGAGKTSVLDAIAIAFGTFVGSFQAGTGLGAAQRDVRLQVTNTELREMEPQYPLVIAGSGIVNGREVDWERQVNTSKSGTTIRDARGLTILGERLQAEITAKQPVVLPIVAYYGTARLWKQKKVTSRKVLASEFYSRTSGYQDCLDPVSSYRFFLDWFRYASQADAEHRNQLLERNTSPSELQASPYAGLIAAVRDAVDECLKLSGWNGLRYSFLHQSVVMRHADHGELPVDQLSDGVRNMVALVADIAFRTVRLNSHLSYLAARLTPGIVLIDEVDMHLHPEWQQQVLTSLRNAFPEIQLIVTTHSPQVLTSVRRENIRTLTLNIEGEQVAARPTARTYGRSNADVMQATMEVPPEPEVEYSDELREYTRSIAQGPLDDPKLLETRYHLDKVFGEDHPALQRADMTIRRRQALGDSQQGSRAKSARREE